ncbi:MAG: hypothetical protein H6Q72_4853 [Firmicutes bacterium]|nr:hypothetical protein [Bacillota bacterium]
MAIHPISISPKSEMINKKDASSRVAASSADSNEEAS